MVTRCKDSYRYTKGFIYQDVQPLLYALFSECRRPSLGGEKEGVETGKAIPVSSYVASGQTWDRVQIKAASGPWPVGWL